MQVARAAASSIVSTTTRRWRRRRQRLLLLLQLLLLVQLLHFLLPKLGVTLAAGLLYIPVEVLTIDLLDYVTGIGNGIT